ncbi:hypothetical protein EBZ37_10650, partial [bacterium]|nr:hypothetical protein [bacterium]
TTASSSASSSTEQALKRHQKKQRFKRAEILFSFKDGLLQEAAALQGEVETCLLQDVRDSKNQLRENVLQFHHKAQLGQQIKQLEWMVTHLKELSFLMRAFISDLESSSLQLNLSQGKLEKAVRQSGRDFHLQNQLKSHLLMWPREPKLTPSGDADEGAIEKLEKTLAKADDADAQAGRFLELLALFVKDRLPSWAERFMTLLGGLDENLELLPA